MAEPKISTAAEPLLLNVVHGEDVERPLVWLMRQVGRYMKASLNRDLWITILMFMAHFFENIFRCLFYKTSITYTKKKSCLFLDLYSTKPANSECLSFLYFVFFYLLDPHFISKQRTRSGLLFCLRMRIMLLLWNTNFFV